MLAGCGRALIPVYAGSLAVTLTHRARNGNHPDGEGFVFAGFSAPNSTPVPDEFFDLLAPNLTESELRVLLYIMRRTFGFKKHADDISLKQIVEGIIGHDGEAIDHGAGVSKPSAVKAVKGLVAQGIITAQRNRSQARGDEPTTYALRFRQVPRVNGVDTGEVNPVYTPVLTALTHKKQSYKKQISIIRISKGLTTKQKRATRDERSGQAQPPRWNRTRTPRCRQAQLRCCR